MPVDPTNPANTPPIKPIVAETVDYIPPLVDPSLTASFHPAPDEPASALRAASLPNVIARTTHHPGNPSDEDTSFTVNVAPLQAGTIIGNRYEIAEEIGRGGMGIVYKAIDKEDNNNLVALKILNNPASGQINEKLLYRFIREGKAHQGLKHPHILECFDFNPQYPYLAMELMEGGSLISPVTNLSIEQKILLVADICDALQYAHQNTLIHRDVKPSNILLGTELTNDDYLQRPVAKLADFGLVLIPDATRVTKTGELAGSAMYMSPEQAGGKRQNLKGVSDLYSIGIILYEIVSGKVPFDGGGSGELLAILQQHQSATPIPLSELRPEISNTNLPPGLEPIIMTLLHKDPAHRYYTQASDLAGDLRSIVKPKKPKSRLKPPPV